MYKTIFTLLFILSNTALTFAQQTEAISTDVKASIQARVEAGLNTGIVVGLMDANGIHFYSHGLKSLKSDAAVDEHSVFEIGSISKTFTCTILAEMVQQGKLSLDDPLQKHLPEGVKAPTRNDAIITLRDIANHTSALPRMPSNFDPADESNPYADYTENLLYEFLNGYELSRDIGSQYEYSNYAMGLLGYTLAKQNNMNYSQMLRKFITKPLDMKNTDIVFTPEMKAQLAKGHTRFEEVPNWDLSTLAGAGAIRSTATDMLKYLSANMGIAKTELYPAMELAHKKSSSNEDVFPIGLSWFIQISDSLQIIEHGGATGGYRAFAGFIKGGDKAVVVLTNSTSGIQDIGMHMLNANEPLKEIKYSIANDIKPIIDKEGIDAGFKAYAKIKAEKAEKYIIDESELNSLGYHYMGKNEMDKAIAVFQKNIKEYPDAFNPYDSMGEAYRKHGDNKKSILNYKKSVELNPANSGALIALEEMGVDTKNLIKEIKVAPATLKSYIGEYQLASDFSIVVSLEEDGLHVKATGQPKFPIFPKSETVFYLKVVPAEIKFYPSEDGKVDKVILFQNGAEMPGTRVVE